MTAARRRPNAEHERRDTPAAGALDFHATPATAVHQLMAVERYARGTPITEPACGDGAIVLPLREAGLRVIASDIVDRGCPDSTVADFFAMKRAPSRRMITNAPFLLDTEFARHATDLFDYVAMLFRLRFIAALHDGLWRETRIPFARLVLTHGRLPMMHRQDYDGPKTDSGMIDFAWFIWARGHRGSPIILRAPATAKRALQP